MAADPSTTRNLVYIDTDMLGLNKKSRFENYVLHPLIRNNWKSTDRLRDSLGFIPALYSSTAGANAGIIRMDARVYWGSPDDPVGFASPWKYLYESDISEGMNPLYDVPYSPIQFADRLVGQLRDPRDPIPNWAEKGSFSIYFNKEDWNLLITSSYVDAAAQGNMQSLLEQEMEGTPFSGRPYFVKYFADSITGDLATEGLQAGDPRMAGSTTTVAPLMRDAFWDHTHFDHTFQSIQHIPSGDSDETYNIEINPIYNFYLDTSPDYEPAVLDLPEPMLPNYYMIEMNYSLASPNNGVVPYGVQTGLGATSFTMSDVFLEATSSNVQISTDYQQISEGYFQFYLNQLDSIRANGSLQSLQESIEGSYKNIAVLSPEVAAGFLEGINTKISRTRGTGGESTPDALTRDNYPFYNKVVIPYTNQYPLADGFFQRVAQQSGAGIDGAEQLLTLLQLFIIHSYGSPTLTGSTGRTVLDLTVADAHADPAHRVVRSGHADVLINLEDFLYNWSLPSTNPGFSSALEELAEHYDFGNAGADAANNFNFNVLKGGFASRAANLPLLDEAENPIRKYFHDVEARKLAILDGATRAIADRFRKFSSFFRGLNTTGYQKCVSEPIMYVVEKRAIANPDDLVQTLFFGRDIRNTNKKGVVYYDTQIKYGVQYSYSIKQVRLVFGNKYRYHPNTATVVSNTTRQQGRAMGNAMGYFAPEDPRYLNTATYALISTDPLSSDWSPALSSPPPCQGTGSACEEAAAYVAEDGELPSPAGRMKWAGYYVYRWSRWDLEPYTTSTATYTNEQAARAGLMGFNYNTSKIIPEATDWTQIPLIARSGEGFDGNWSGGFVPAPITIADLPPETTIDSAAGLSSQPFVNLEALWNTQDWAYCAGTFSPTYLVSRTVQFLYFLTQVLGPLAADYMSQWLAAGDFANMSSAPGPLGEELTEACALDTVIMTCWEVQLSFGHAAAGSWPAADRVAVGEQLTWALEEYGIVPPNQTFLATSWMGD
jgi:hypothetical protein